MQARCAVRYPVLAAANTFAADATRRGSPFPVPVPRFCPVPPPRGGLSTKPGKDQQEDLLDQRVPGMFGLMVWRQSGGQQVAKANGLKEAPDEIRSAEGGCILESELLRENTGPLAPAAALCHRAVVNPSGSSEDVFRRMP